MAHGLQALPMNKDNGMLFLIAVQMKVKHGKQLHILKSIEMK